MCVKIQLVLLMCIFSLMEGTQLLTKIQIREADGVKHNISANATPQPFRRIGSKFYYIDHGLKLNWFNAAHKCRQLGGHLAHVESQEELDLLNTHLDRSLNYWLDVNDLGQGGKYVSIATGFPVEFLKWAPNNPNNMYGVEHCVHLWFSYNNELTMNDENCDSECHYICETNTPRTVSIIVW